MRKNKIYLVKVVDEIKENEIELIEKKDDKNLKVSFDVFKFLKKKRENREETFKIVVGEKYDRRKN